jgi:hypothetical protein
VCGAAAQVLRLCSRSVSRAARLLPGVTGVQKLTTDKALQQSLIDSAISALETSKQVGRRRALQPVHAVAHVHACVFVSVTFAHVPHLADGLWRSRSLQEGVRGGGVRCVLLHSQVMRWCELTVVVRRSLQHPGQGGGQQACCD